MPLVTSSPGVQKGRERETEREDNIPQRQTMTLVRDWRNSYGGEQQGVTRLAGEEGHRTSRRRV